MKKGIILKTDKREENSKIAHIYTPTGLESYLIRGSLSYKSRNYRYSQELSKIEFDFANTTKNTFNVMKSGALIDSYENIKFDYEKLKSALEITILLYKIHEHANYSENLYDLLDFCLNGIENSEYFKYYNWIFKLKLLFLLGIAPNFKNCLECNSSENLKFSISDGGYLCVDHQINKNLFDPLIIEAIRLLYLTKLDKINEYFILSIDNIIKSSNLIDTFLYLYYDVHYNLDLNKLSSI